MTFTLVFDKKAAKELSKLQKNIKQRIFSKLIETKKDPKNFFEKLTEREDYKLRVGKFRIIADINTKEQRIEVTKIGLRKNIYKKI